GAAGRAAESSGGACAGDAVVVVSAGGGLTKAASPPVRVAETGSAATAATSAETSRCGPASPGIAGVRRPATRAATSTTTEQVKAAQASQPTAVSTARNRVPSSGVVRAARIPSTAGRSSGKGLPARRTSATGSPATSNPSTAAAARPPAIRRTPPPRTAVVGMHASPICGSFRWWRPGRPVVPGPRYGTAPPDVSPRALAAACQHGGLATAAVRHHGGLATASDVPRWRPPRRGGPRDAGVGSVDRGGWLWQLAAHLSHELAPQIEDPPHQDQGEHRQAGDDDRRRYRGVAAIWPPEGGRHDTYGDLHVVSLLLSHARQQRVDDESGEDQQQRGTRNVELGGDRLGSRQRLEPDLVP